MTNVFYKKLSALFVHTGPKYCYSMQIALPMFAGILSDNGFPSLCFNEVAHKKNGGNRNFIDIIKEYSPEVVVLPVHWYQQLFYVLNAIKTIRELFPSILIVSGGYTASFFYNDFMKSENHPDFIIRGEGEIPLLQLMKSIKNNTYANVSNLVYTDSAGKLCVNEISYIPDSGNINMLDYSRLDLVLNREDVMSFYQDIVPARGCPHRCRVCSGSRQGQRIITGRTESVFFELDNINSYIRHLYDYGAKRFSLIYFEGYERLYLNILEKISKLEITSIVIGSCTLFSNQFLCLLSELQHSTSIGFAVEYIIKILNEDLRNKYYDFRFSNKELEKQLDCLNRFGIEVEICLNGSLLNSPDLVANEKEYAEYLSERYDCEIKQIYEPIEPGSELSINPSEFGISSECSFDYYCQDFSYQRS